MNVDRKEISPLNEEITLTISTEDYESEFKDELRQYRQKASLKGFRKGKTPLSVVKRMFGKSLLAEIIQKKLEEGINSFITDNNLKTLGQPIPCEGQEDQEFNTNELEDFVYKFEIGLSPSFEVAGLSRENSFPKFAIKVPDHKVEEELDRLRKRMGQFEDVEDATIEESDLVDFEAKELDGEAVKEKGWETYFSIGMDRLVDNNLKEELLGKKKNHVTRVDLTNLEANTDQKFINKYYLNLDENEEKDIGNSFEAKVAKIRRMKPAEMNEDFYKQAFGKPEIDNEEKAREEIVNSYQDAYGKQADILLFRDVQDHLLEVNELQLPEAFLKKWLVFSNPEIEDSQLDNEFGAFKNNLKWNLIRNKLIEKYGIEIDAQEIKDSFTKQISQYFGGSVDPELPYIKETVDKMMENREQVEKVYQDLMFDRIYEAMEADISIDPKPIELEDFEKLLEEKQNENKVSALVDSEEE